MLPVQALKVRSLDIDRMEVTWEIAETQDDVYDYKVEVLRSESPVGVFDVISPPFEDRYIFVDSRIPTGDRYRQLWYKLRVTRKRDGEVEELGPATLEAEPDLVAQYIRRHEMVQLTQAIGRSVWLFKRRTFGPRCPSCYDAITRVATKDYCMDCFSTGMLRGYHSPIEIWMQIDPSGKAQEVAGQHVQPVLTRGRTSFYPNINPLDVIVEAENKRWRVETVTLSERLRTPVKQEVTLRALELTDIEFKIPINVQKALRDIQPSPPRMYDRAVDFDAAIAERTPNVFATFETNPEHPED